MAGSVASGSASPSGERPSTGSKSTRRESDAGPSGADGPKDSKPWTEGEFAYEYVQIAQVSQNLETAPWHAESLHDWVSYSSRDRS